LFALGQHVLFKSSKEKQSVWRTATPKSSPRNGRLQLAASHDNRGVRREKNQSEDRPLQKQARKKR
jgi:hypothetical protein